MDAIPVNISSGSIKNELDYLIARELGMKFKGVRKMIIYLLFISLTLGGILIFIPSQKVATLSGILLYLLCFAWLIVLLYVAKYVALKFKRIKWRDATIKNALSRQSKYHIQFDEERIVFTTESYTSEINWRYYKYFAEYNQMLFILKEDTLYESLSFSPTDLDKETLYKLKTVAASKLTPLPPI